jgi:transcriptional regulator with XRE-family HTH domain
MRSDNGLMDRRPRITTEQWALALVRHRTARRLSQSALSRAIGVDHSYVSRLESGRRQPSRDTVNALAHAFGFGERERNEFLALAGFSDVPMAPELFELSLLMEQPLPQWVRRLIVDDIDAVVNRVETLLVAAGLQPREAA